MLIDKEDSEYLRSEGLIVDGYFGGLIIGNSHEIGGIPILSHAEGESYELVAEMEGFEFLMNVVASSKYHERITEINNELAEIKANISIEMLWNNLGEQYPELKIVNTLIEDKTTIFKSKFVLIHGQQFIVNKYSSLMYYEELYKMNHRCKSQLPMMLGY
ncbi:hypothetical protein [Telluribacter humicola]|uniref:hypothetical protein n=1 Tax=Telluribacter humicola TaxID=1720261 RepID=UPI001A96C4BF|nr:hypothetical protein [Telluribacter humicola]